VLTPGVLLIDKIDRHLIDRLTMSRSEIFAESLNGFTSDGMSVCAKIAANVSLRDILNLTEQELSIKLSIYLFIYLSDNFTKTNLLAPFFHINSVPLEVIVLFCFYLPLFINLSFGPLFSIFFLQFVHLKYSSILFPFLHINSLQYVFAQSVH